MKGGMTGGKAEGDSGVGKGVISRSVGEKTGDGALERLYCFLWFCSRVETTQGTIGGNGDVRGL